MKCFQQAPERPGEPNLREQRHASSRVAGDRSAVAEHKPPTFAPRFFGHGGKKALGFRIAERKERQLLAPVERGDDTRRPPAEASAAGEE